MGSTLIPPHPRPSREYQRLSALMAANEVRFARAEVKRGLAAMSAPDGREAAARYVLTPPPSCAGMEVGALLRACRELGSERVGYMLGKVGVDESQRLSDLEDGERRWVAHELQALAHDLRARGR